MVDLKRPALEYLRWNKRGPGFWRFHRDRGVPSRSGLRKADDLEERRIIVFSVAFAHLEQPTRAFRLLT